MVGHIAVQPKPAEPAVGQIEMNLLAEPTPRADAEAIADQQHPDHQFRIDRRAPDHAVERCELAPQFTELDEPIDRAQQMISGNVPLQRELIEQRSLFDLPKPHHDSVLSRRLNQRESKRATEDFFNTIGHARTFPGVALMAFILKADLRPKPNYHPHPPAA